ncbi:MAG: lactonase family protein [Candidatus Solibacter usitatus]|nr:lactonase family protein [Candidatus Solibacter usitatus]
MKWISKFCLLALVSLMQAAPKSEYFVYIGTYTDKGSKGIYGFRFHPSGGRLEPMGLMAETVSPSYVAASPNHKFLYAVNETDNFGGQKAGSVSAYAIDGKTGKLTFLNQVSSRGGAPCHLVVDKTNKCVLVANYNGGSVAAFPIKEDGRLGEASAFVQHTGSSVDKGRQEGPHAHGIYASADNRFAVAADLGLDQVVVYKLDAANGALTPNDPPFAKVPPGGGPRHFAFHPTAKFGYTNNEMTSSVTAFTYDAGRGALNSIQTISTLPKDFSGDNSTAEIAAHPSGRFLYVSNRGHNSIAVFAIDAKKGTLTALEHASTQGKTPRGFAIDPTGGYLLAGNQDTDNIMIFKIDPKSGRLKAGKLVEAPRPVAVAFVPVAAK